MVGAVVVVFMHNIPYKWFQVFPVFLLPLSVVLLGLVMMMERINGAARWMTFMGIQFQPSEVAKMAVIIVTVCRCGSTYSRRSCGHGDAHSIHTLRHRTETE